jgi:hypothetical protein
MGQGQYTLADLQQGAPQTGQFTVADINSAPPGVAQPNVTMQTSPMSLPEQVGAHVAGRVASMANHAVEGAKSIANDVYDVSTPNIADQLQKHFRGLANDLDKIPAKAVVAFLAAGGIPEGEAAELAPEMTASKAGEASAEAAPMGQFTPADIGKVPVPGAGIPRTLSGESALRQVLTGQDNANLLKIAKSRGINIAQESQLKPGVADSRLINKIVDDFSDDELENLRSTYLENTRMGRHDFGEIGPEAWKTMGLQTYFPDVKVSAATLKRTQSAIAAASKSAPDTAAPSAAGDDDLLKQLQESLRKVQQRKQATALP